MKRECNLTAEMLRELLDYNAETGEFRWRFSAGKAKPENIAGTMTEKGYRRICIGGRRYRAHRLAWLYVHGEWPRDQIDHINGVRDDNRIANLREANNQQNNQNALKAKASNKYGLLGIYRRKGSSTFRAEIIAAGVKTRLGSFATAEEAHAAYLKAKAELHPFSTIAKGC